MLRREIKERMYCRIIALVRFAVLRMSARTSLRIGTAVGLLAYRLAGAERRLALENLRSCFPGMPERELRRIARSSFRNLGMSIVEIIRFPLLTRDSVNSFVSFEGKERLDAALRKGKGVVLATGHVGNWELFGASLALNGYPLTVVARELRSRRYNDILCDLRRQVGMKILFRGESMFRGLRWLKENGILAILADVDTKTPGVFVEFFGRPAYTPSGPVAVALKTGAALIPMFIRRLSDNTHRIHVLEPLDPVRTDSWESDLLVNTQRLTNVVESFIREYPDQWIWLHKRWRKTAGNPAPGTPVPGENSHRPKGGGEPVSSDPETSESFPGRKASATREAGRDGESPALS